MSKGADVYKERNYGPQLVFPTCTVCPQRYGRGINCGEKKGLNCRGTGLICLVRKCVLPDRALWLFKLKLCLWKELDVLFNMYIIHSLRSKELLWKFKVRKAVTVNKCLACVCPGVRPELQGRKPFYVLKEPHFDAFLRLRWTVEHGRILTFSLEPFWHLIHHQAPYMVF